MIDLNTIRNQAWLDIRAGMPFDEFDKFYPELSDEKQSFSQFNADVMWWMPQSEDRNFYPEIFTAEQVEVAPIEEPWFVERVWERLWERKEAILTTAEQQAAEQIWFARWALRQTWALFGWLSDIIWEWLVSAYKTAWEPWKEQFKKLAQTELWQSAIQTLWEWMEAWQDFKEINPEVAKDIESVINIAEFIPIAKWTTAAARLTEGWVETVWKKVVKWAWKVWEIISEQAWDVLQREKKDFVKDLLSPEWTKKERLAEIRAWKVKEWVLWRTTTPSPVEVKSIEEVSKIPWINKSNTNLQNNNIIRDEIVKEATSLDQALKANDVIFPRKELNSFLENWIDNIKKNKLLRWDAKQVALDLLDEFKIIMKNKPSKWSALLEWRKEFDRLVKEFRWDKVLDPNIENALSIANREVRQWANNFLSKKAQNVDVRNSFNKQSSLFNALETTAIKADKEAKNAIWRFLWRVKNKLWLSSELAWVLATIWATWWLTFLTSVAPVVVWAWVAWIWAVKLWKLAFGAKSRKAIWEALKKADKALNKSPKDFELRKIKSWLESLNKWDVMDIITWAWVLWAWEIEEDTEEIFKP